jgi:hypothetical protein
MLGSALLKIIKKDKKDHSVETSRQQLAGIGVALGSQMESQMESQWRVRT